MLDVYGGEQGMNAPNGGMSPTSNPTKLTVKREYTGMNSYHSGITNQLTSYNAHSAVKVKNPTKFWLLGN